MAKLIKGVNDLKTLYPKLEKEWDMEANGFGPDEVTAFSGKKAIWKCEVGHRYSAMISNRTRQNTKCPYCAGKKPLKGVNTLADLYPSLAEEWDMEANGFGPDEVTAFSGKKAIWKCEVGHRYSAVISNRTSTELH